MAEVESDQAGKMENEDYISGLVSLVEGLLKMIYTWKSEELITKMRSELISN